MMIYCKKADWNVTGAIFRPQWQDWIAVGRTTCGKYDAEMLFDFAADSHDIAKRLDMFDASLPDDYKRFDVFDPANEPAAYIDD